MITGKTSSGFEFAVDETKLDNMEYLDALSEIDTNSLAFSKVLRLTLGTEQRDKLYDHLRTEDGRVPVQTVLEEFEEIMNASAETKNS